MGTNSCRFRAKDDEDVESSSDDASARESEDDGDRKASAEAPMSAKLYWLLGCAQLKSNLGFTSSKALKMRSAPSASRSSKALLADNTGKSLDQYFDVDRRNVVGEGGYASVCIGKDRRTGINCAVKCIKKDLVASKGRLQREIDVVMTMDHPNINKLFQTFEDQRYIYLVLELCAGGELFDRIQEVGHLTEREAAIIMQQIFRAVYYMHTNGVCHRDLKPENFLFLVKGPIEGNTLKVIDFGIAATFKSRSDTFSTRTGTPYYVAPEVLAFPYTQYDAQCDMWSCGIIMYVLLSGRLPFRGKDDNATFAKVKLGKFSFPADVFGRVTEDGKNLIRRLLTRDPAQRCTAEAAVNDPWASGHAPQAAPAPLQDTVLQSIRLFQAENKLKKAARHVVARHLNDEQIQQLRSVFMELDSNGDGHLTGAELSEGLRRADLGQQRPEDLSALIRSLDVDGSGEIDYTEFLAATLEQRHYNNEAACWAAFRVFDKNDDGKISQKELAEVLASQDVLRAVGAEHVSEVMREVDRDGDGFIDFEEFMAMMAR